MTIQMDAIASASSASWYHSGTPKLSCKQCLCIYKAPCLARACWAQPKPVVLHRADAGFAFLQNALSARCKSAQPSRFRDVHRDWDCIPTSRIRTANLQCHACLSLCIYRGTACWYNVIDETKTVSSKTVIWLCRFPKHSNIEVLTGAESGKTACLVSIQELLTA